MLNRQAAVSTAYKLALCTLAALAFNLVLYTVPPVYLGIAGSLVLLVVAVRWFYQSEVDRIEGLRRLNNTR